MREGTGEHALEDSGRGSRTAFWLAWSLAGLSVAMFLAQVVLWALARGAHLPGNLEVDLTLGSLLGAGAFLAFPLVGALGEKPEVEVALVWRLPLACCSRT